MPIIFPWREDAAMAENSEIIGAMFKTRKVSAQEDHSTDSDAETPEGSSKT
jgi:hypothetical protein